MLSEPARIDTDGDLFMDGIFFLMIFMFMCLQVWLLFCCAVSAVVMLIQWIRKRQLDLGTIRISAYATLCVIMLMLMYLIYRIMYTLMWLGIWLALCFTVTMITVIVQLINRKLRKKKPIHWAKKTAGYAAFYIISLFVVMKLWESYPGNWLWTDKEYRELAYELHHLNLEYYEYDYISEGSQGEIFFSFISDNVIRDRSLARIIWQRDFIAIKNAVEEYIKINGSFQEERIEIEFLAGFGVSGAWEYAGHIYNFNPETGEMGTDGSYWFISDIEANNCTELAEFYHDFSGISTSVETMDDIQELANLYNLTYLQLDVGGTVRVDKDLKEQYLEELNTLLPNCEIHIK